MRKYVVPILESERGWGSKIDGYFGLFDSLEEAEDFKMRYNLKFNSSPTVPDWYMVACDPEIHRNQEYSVYKGPSLLDI